MHQEFKIINLNFFFLGKSQSGQMTFFSLFRINLLKNYMIATETATELEKKRPLLALRHWILLSVFLMLIGSGTLLVGYGIFKSMPVFRKPSSKVSFPISGQQLIISSAKTYWRKVEAKDKVAEGMLFIPEVQLTFSPSSQEAEFLCFFKNENQIVQGDGVIFKLTRAMLEQGELITVTGTVGFSKDSHFRAYRYTKDEFWQLVIKEKNTQGGEDLVLANLDISAKLFIPPST